MGSINESTSIGISIDPAEKLLKFVEIELLGLCTIDSEGFIEILVEHADSLFEKFNALLGSVLAFSVFAVSSSESDSLIFIRSGFEI